MINQSAIEAQAEKLKIETNMEIIAVYTEFGSVQYFPASTKLAEGFELLYATKESEDK
ncbi:MAG: hypothetical protein K0Q53_135 [Massilibacillus sp.]|jgi:hypothetical protein|nr:hypothetical protein [Massilibacillus sp.]